MNKWLLVVIFLVISVANIHAQQGESAKGQWVEGKQSADDGATRDYYNRAAQLAWARQMGDWRDVNDMGQGDAAYGITPLVDDDTPGYIEWEVTTLAREWIGKVVPNKGVLLRRVSGSGTFNFYSREYTDPAKRPERMFTWPLQPINVWGIRIRCGSRIPATPCFGLI